MEKEWCTYSWQGKLLPEKVGKIVGESFNRQGPCISVQILYSEGQMYSAEWWDINYVVRFDTLEEAFNFLWKNRPSYDTRLDRDWYKEEYLEHMKYCFPSYKPFWIKYTLGKWFEL